MGIRQVRGKAKKTRLVDRLIGVAKSGDHWAQQRLLTLAAQKPYKNAIVKSIKRLGRPKTSSRGITRVCEPI